MKLNVKVANGIKLFRLQKQLTQEELAARCGMDRTYISGIERGTRNVTINSLEKIIVLGLRISTRDFFYFIEDEDNEL